MSMYAKLGSALEKLGKAHGRGQLMLELGVKLTPSELKDFNESLDDLVRWGEVIEFKTQTPGTGLAGPPHFDYTYTLTPKGHENGKRRRQDIRRSRRYP